MGKIGRCLLILLFFFRFDLIDPASAYALKGPDPSVDQYLKSDQEGTSNEGGKWVGQGEKNPPSYWALAGKVLLALAIVLILLLGFVKWMGRGRRKTGGASVQVVASLWLSQQKSIKLVRVGSHLFLIGVGENINLLYH
ncbi:exported hypothetical protein [[Clostridium] ultunense Esp]|nr:exported hypothetical protein [[Clostridium] ultunense Esp]